MGPLMIVSLSAVLGVIASNLIRSALTGWSHARRMREAVEERRRALPEDPVALADAVTGEPIALRGRVRVDEGCDPFLPLSKLETLASPDLGVVALSARDLAGGVQEVVAGARARLVVGDNELPFVVGDAEGGHTRLVLGTYQTRGRDDGERWSIGRQTNFFALSDGDEVWVVGTLTREVDAGGKGDYRAEPTMRYALAEPLSFYALGEVEVPFRRLPVGGIDTLGAVIGFMLGMMLIPAFW